MTVEELIKKLQEMDKDAKVVITIMQGNKSYPVAYTVIDILDRCYSGCRIATWLPDNMHTVERKR